MELVMVMHDRDGHPLRGPQFPRRVLLPQHFHLTEGGLLRVGPVRAFRAFEDMPPPAGGAILFEGGNKDGVEIVRWTQAEGDDPDLIPAATSFIVRLGIPLVASPSPEWESVVRWAFGFGDEEKVWPN